MPDFSVISDVSETLRRLLEDELKELTGPPQVKVHHLLTDPSPPVVTIFLFEVLEDSSARNRPRVRQPDPNGVRLKKPDLALVLRYLITPWIGEQAYKYQDQLILGRIAQVFYDNAILSGRELHGSSLLDTTEALRVTMTPLTLEDRTRIWNALQKPYRVSLSYEVRVVRIEPEQFQLAGTVGSRTLEHGEVEEGP